MPKGIFKRTVDRAHRGLRRHMRKQEIQYRFFPGVFFGKLCNGPQERFSAVIDRMDIRAMAQEQMNLLRIPTVRGMPQHRPAGLAAMLKF